MVIVAYIAPYGNIQEAMFEQEELAGLFTTWLLQHGMYRHSLTRYADSYDEVRTAFTGGKWHEMVQSNTHS